MIDTNEAPSPGEARLKTARARFWRYCVLGLTAALAIGILTGTAKKAILSGTLNPWNLVALWVAVLAAFIWYSVGYFQRVDEVDQQDNLWAGLIGLCFYMLALPSWYLFYDVGLTGSPNQYAVYLATVVVMFLAYTLRKLGWR